MRLCVEFSIGMELRTIMGGGFGLVGAWEFGIGEGKGSDKHWCGGKVMGYYWGKLLV